jgi:hypothetical protein
MRGWRIALLAGLASRRFGGQNDLVSVAIAEPNSPGFERCDRQHALGRASAACSEARSPGRGGWIPVNCNNGGRNGHGSSLLLRAKDARELELGA